MKIKTKEKLQDLIDEDLAWRKKELIEVKLHISSFHNKTMIRMGIALLSAHFEGFVKQAANYYVCFVSSQHIEMMKLKKCFLAMSCIKSMSVCAETEKITAIERALDKCIEKYNNQTFKVSYSAENPIIKTQSNPSSVVFKEIVNSIGLDYEPYKMMEKYIDTDLQRNRHAVVHGEKNIIDERDFMETYEHIIDIMESFKAQVIEAAELELYMDEVC